MKSFGLIAIVFVISLSSFAEDSFQTLYRHKYETKTEYIEGKCHKRVSDVCESWTFRSRTERKGQEDQVVSNEKVLKRDILLKYIKDYKNPEKKSFIYSLSIATVVTTVELKAAPLMLLFPFALAADLFYVPVAVPYYLFKRLGKKINGVRIAKRLKRLLDDRKVRSMNVRNESEFRTLRWILI